MKQKASEYKCVVCKKSQADTWHHLILPGRGTGRKESDDYVIPVCGEGKGFDGLCHDKCQSNQITLQKQGLYLLMFRQGHKGGRDINLIIANYLTVGDITKILRKELDKPKRLG